MTLPELKALIQDRGLDAALDAIHPSEVPEDLRFAWHTAVQARGEHDYRKSVIKEFLERED